MLITDLDKVFVGSKSRSDEVGTFGGVGDGYEDPALGSVEGILWQSVSDVLLKVCHDVIFPVEGAPFQAVDMHRSSDEERLCVLHPANSKAGNDSANIFLRAYIEITTHLDYSEGCALICTAVRMRNVPGFRSLRICADLQDFCRSLQICADLQTFCSSLQICADSKKN